MNVDAGERRQLGLLLVGCRLLLCWLLLCALRWWRMVRATNEARAGGAVAVCTCCCVLGPRQTTPCAVHDLVCPGPASVAP